MMGRWRSGAPLALCPFHDDPELGADPRRRNDFLYREDDPAGFKTPGGSHIRRANPRDASIAGFARIHRMIRRGTAYGPLLAEGVLEDDGADRGLMFAFVGAHPGTPVRVRPVAMDKRWRFLRGGRRQGSHRRVERRGRRFYSSSTACPQTPSGPAAVRRYARRRVWLHARTAGLALACRPSDMKGKCRKC